MECHFSSSSSYAPYLFFIHSRGENRTYLKHNAPFPHGTIGWTTYLVGCKASRGRSGRKRRKDCTTSDYTLVLFIIFGSFFPSHIPLIFHSHLSRTSFATFFPFFAHFMLRLNKSSGFFLSSKKKWKKYSDDKTERQTGVDREVTATKKARKLERKGEEAGAKCVIKIHCHSYPPLQYVCFLSSVLVVSCSISFRCVSFKSIGALYRRRKGMRANESEN